jgi:hypothetical protein
MKGTFSEESLKRFAELAAGKQSSDFSEGQTYDFTRCVKPSGKAYGTAGACKKGVEEEAPVYTPAGSIRGRVPRNDPKEPLASGSTPLEKAEAKLKQFEAKINRPSVRPSERELEQYGKLKNAVDEFKNKIEGRQVKKGILGRKVEDRSDLDDSKLRKGGVGMRVVFPDAQSREVLKNTLKASQAVDRLAPLLRSRRKLTKEEVKLLKDSLQTLKDRQRELTAHTQSKREEIYKKMNQGERDNYLEIMREISRNTAKSKDKLINRIYRHNKLVKEEKEAKKATAAG